MRKQKKLTPHDRVRIAAEAIAAPRTVERIYAGARCAATTRERICRAAEKLGLPLPPDAADAEPHEAA